MSENHNHNHKISRPFNSCMTGEPMYSVNGPEIKGVQDYEDWGYTKETAERIAACLNACAGVSNHKLELIERSGGVESLIERNIKNAIIDALVIKQRDELLAELKSAIEHIDFKHEAYARAYTLIAKVEAEK